jgi:hypothetical protein
MWNVLLAWCFVIARVAKLWRVSAGYQLAFVAWRRTNIPRVAAYSETAGCLGCSRRAKENRELLPLGRSTEAIMSVLAK